MNPKIKIAVIVLLLFLTAAMVYKFETDEDFLASIRYRYKGWIYPHGLYEFAIGNFDDTLFVAHESYSSDRRRIRVTWSGDTIWTYDLGIYDYPAPPPYEYSGYDSSVIRVKQVSYGAFDIVPTSVGISRLIVTKPDDSRDTVQLRVLQKGDRLVIEGDVVILLHKLGPPSE